MNKNKFKNLPKFKTEDEERKFWAKNNSTDYFDWSQAERGVRFSKLKLSTQTISLRLPLNMFNDLRVLANIKDIPYQSYIKVILARELKKEMADVI